MGESVVFAGGIGGIVATGAFLGPNGNDKYPSKFVADLMDLTRLLLRKAPRSEAKQKSE